MFSFPCAVVCICNRPKSKYPGVCNTAYYVKNNLLKLLFPGIDLQDNAELMQGAVPGSSELDVSRIANQIRLKIKEYQESFLVIEKVCLV